MSVSQGLSGQDVTIGVEVGPDKCLFKLSRQLLCLKSPFFNAALTNGFKETKSGHVWLQELDSNAFKTFKVWIYTGELKGVQIKPSSKRGRLNETWRLDLNLYKIAEFLGIVDLQNHVMDALISMSAQSRVPVDLAQNFWDQTSSPQLRNFLLDAFLSKQSVGIAIGSSEEVLSKDFIYEVAKELSSLTVVQRTLMHSAPHRIVANPTNSFKKYHILDPKKMCQIDPDSVCYSVEDLTNKSDASWSETPSEP